MSKVKTLVVLGMHRSATSLVAKALHDQYNVSMGHTYHGTTPHNVWGNHEDSHAIKLNTDILRAAGGGPLSPPSEKAILEQAEPFADRIQEFIRMHEQPPIWGWKDPRTTLTVRLFLPYLSDPHFICCFRTPSEVADSMMRRGDLKSRERVKALVREYNARLLRFLSEQFL